jgi:exodeoxyribonuclease VII small subunit
MSKNEFKDASFSELMSELNKLESAIEQRELDDLDRLMTDVTRAEAIIDELQARLKKAERKIEQAKTDPEA